MIKTLRKIILWPFKFVAEFTNNVYETLVYFTTKHLTTPNGIVRLSHSLDTKCKLRILGNGQSLSDILDDMNNQDHHEYMVVNRHVLSDSYATIKPKFYTIADSHFYQHEEGLSVMSMINDITQWQMHLFIPYEPSAQKAVKKIISNPKIHIHFYNSGTYRGFPCIQKWLYNRNLSMPTSQNVLVAALYLSLHLGFSDIELYGVEHSWTRNLSVNEHNEVCLENPHFFDKSAGKTKTWKEIQHEEAHMHDVLRMYAQMFESYWDIAQIALQRNAVIVNKTKGSFIDAFPKE